MTLFHFGNCFALAYFPYFITYKCSGLSEYSAFWRCVQAGATYVLVQLGKMLFLATFFPTWEGPSGGFDLLGEFLRATVDVADLGGLQLALGRGGGRGELRILVAALGWASAELLTARGELRILVAALGWASAELLTARGELRILVAALGWASAELLTARGELRILVAALGWASAELLTARGELRILVAALGWASAELLTARCVPLWVGARGVEFDWRHLQMGLDSNISLVRHVAAAALLWASGRHDLPSPLRLPLGGLLAAAAYEGFLIGWAGQVLGLGPWGALGLRALGAAALGLGALRLLVPLLPPP